MELIQEIGSYAGLAAIPGLAILSALLFSQARDVRRLREWAGRAPERAGTVAQQQATRVVARPGAQPAAQPSPQAAPQPVRTGAAAAASGSQGGTATAAPPRTGAPPTPGGPKPIAPRIPASTAAGQTSILGPAGGGPPQDPWYRRLADRLPAGRYIAIILVGIAVVGGGAAFGITQLSGDDSSGGKAAKSDNAGSQKAEQAKPTPVKPEDVSVTVLNGTVVTGLAHNIGTRLSSEGFQLENQLTATEGGVAESVVLFKPGANREAQLVAKELDISQIEPADSNATAQGGNAEVIVLVGADLAQQ